MLTSALNALVKNPIKESFNITFMRNDILTVFLTINILTVFLTINILTVFLTINIFDSFFNN